MTLSATADFPHRSGVESGRAFIPTSASSTWVDAIVAGTVGTAVDLADNANITNAVTQIVNATRRAVSKAKLGVGTNVLARLAVPAALTVSTPPTVALFGRMQGDSAWNRLRTRDGSLNLQLALESLKYDTDGTFKYSTPNPLTDAFDCQGADEFLVGVEIALAGSGANAFAAKVQLKIF